MQKIKPLDCSLVRYEDSQVCKQHARAGRAGQQNSLSPIRLFEEKSSNLSKQNSHASHLRHHRTTDSCEGEPACLATSGMIAELLQAPVNHLDFPFVDMFELVPWCDFVGVPHQGPALVDTGWVQIQPFLEEFPESLAMLGCPCEHCSWRQDWKRHIGAVFFLQCGLDVYVTIRGFVLLQLLFTGPFHRAPARRCGYHIQLTNLFEDLSEGSLGGEDFPSQVRERVCRFGSRRLGSHGLLAS